MKKKTVKKQSRKTNSNALSLRGFRDLVGTGSANADWWIQSLSEDADLWQNSYLLTARMRDLFKTNPIFIKYREILWANVFGDQGLMLRMKIKETEDRVIHTPDEKVALLQWEKRINRIIDWANRQDGGSRDAYRAYKLAEHMATRSKPEDILERKAIVQVGDPDIFANQIWERWWEEWQKAKFADIRGRRSYNTLRQLRLINCVRDGDIFIRPIMDPKINEMGFTIQLISAEWCDRFYNTSLPNGNVVIMGIEYQMSPYGIGKPVAFYFIKRQPNDWQFTLQGAFNFANGANLHTRIPADEIIHYARPVDADATRPAPWAASTIPSSRQLDQAMLAEVIAWRESACKTGFYYSDVLPEGGAAQIDLPDPRNCPTEFAAPGGVTALEWGVKYQDRNPTHPNASVADFRKAAGRHSAAGMPGGDYNLLFNDLESINFSAGRLGRLDTNAVSNVLQTFDIEVAEVPIFEKGMEMALIVGAVPLPNTKAKLAKFNKPVFQGPKQPQVDEIKAANASALRVANKFSSRTKECADMGIDFDNNLLELAEEEIAIQAFGLKTETTVESGSASPPQDAGEDDGTEEETPTGQTTKPAATKKPSANGSNGKNGKHKTEILERISMPISLGSRKKKISIIRDKSQRIVAAVTEDEIE